MTADPPWSSLISGCKGIADGGISSHFLYIWQHKSHVARFLLSHIIAVVPTSAALPLNNFSIPGTCVDFYAPILAFL
jgi:hypothetical protein